MSSVRESIARVRYDSGLLGQSVALDVVQELWSDGWTFTKRKRQPFDVLKQSDIPRNMAYQWVTSHDRAQFTERGWVAVPAGRHNGIFAPIDYDGDIVVSGNVLMERPKDVVDAEHAQRVSKAHQNVEDWKAKYGGEFSGGVRVWTGDHRTPPSEFEVIGNAAVAAKVIESATPTPVLPSAEPTRIRRPRHWSLRWLFNLISTEA